MPLLQLRLGRRRARDVRMPLKEELAVVCRVTRWERSDEDGLAG